MSRVAHQAGRVVGQQLASPTFTDRTLRSVDSLTIVLEPSARPDDTAEPASGRRWRRPLLGVLLGSLAGGLGLTAPPPELQRPIREGRQRADVAHREAFFRWSLALADVGAVAAAVVLCVVGLAHVSLEPLALLALPLVVLAGKASGIYDREGLVVNNATIDEAPRLFQLATLYALLFAILQRQLASGPLAATELLALWATMFVFSVLARGLARTVARAATGPERCLFVGSESSSERLRMKLAGASGHAVLVGRMSIGDALEPEDASEAVNVLRRLVDEWGIQRVIIEPSEPSPQVTLDFVREAKETGARVSLLPRILEVVGTSIEVDDVDGLTLLGVRHFGLSRSSAMLKRAFDVVGAGLLVLAFAPLLVAIALVIRIDSRGPVIYRQTRIGRNGRPFTIFKFRTMVDGADALKPSLRALNEAHGLFKIADDPRVTRVGRRLRRYSLDELPQLINVLRGEMSLVGPRPLVQDDDEQITGLDRRRLYLTPGMTGRWQILGSARVPLAEMIKLDYLYVTGWSLWSDVKILLRTVPYVLARRGM
jgi:exopolysaccharide biosynthesis polyprenyl glycosylphosphotransferase